MPRPPAAEPAPSREPWPGGRGPAEAFATFRQEILGHAPEVTPGLYADDVVVEMPFAPPGHPRRTEGLEAFAALVRAGRAALPVRFDAMTDVVVHLTSDPATAVVEYRLTGTSTATGRTSSAAFVVVVTVGEDGRVTRWREYQDRQAIMAALSPAP